MLTNKEYNEQSLEFEFEEININIRSKIKERVDLISNFVPKNSYILLNFDTIENGSNNRVVILEDTYKSLKNSLKNMNWEQKDFSFIENLECSIYDKTGKLQFSKSLDISEDSDEDFDSSIYTVIIDSLKSIEKQLLKIDTLWINEAEFYLYKFKNYIYTISKGFNYVDCLIETTSKDYWEQDNVIIDPSSKDFPYERNIDSQIIDLAYKLKTTNDNKKIEDFLKTFVENYIN